jgi:blue copper oxidase
MPLNVIGTDGGLLPEVISKSFIMLMPGERIDVWADFGKLAGQQVVLKSLAFNSSMMGWMMGMGGSGMMSSGMGGRGMGMGMSGSGMGMAMSGGMANGSEMEILTVNVSQTAKSTPTLGPLPKMSVKFDASNVSNFASPRPFVLSMGMMMAWTINGRQYDMTAVAEDEKVKLNDTVAWRFTNLSPIPHPLHLHNTHFQVIRRVPSAMPSDPSIRDGLIDSGWKDPVSVWPGEQVVIAMNFGPHAGKYMYLCLSLSMKIWA